MHMKYLRCHDCNDAEVVGIRISRVRGFWDDLQGRGDENEVIVGDSNITYLAGDAASWQKGGIQ